MSSVALRAATVWGPLAAAPVPDDRRHGPTGREDRTVSGTARPRYDPWTDVDGTPIPVGARVEQVTEAKEHGAYHSRLHQRGKVIRRGQRGRGHLRLYVRFESEEQPVSIRPHLVRVIEGDTDRGS